MTVKHLAKFSKENDYWTGYCQLNIFTDTVNGKKIFSNPGNTVTEHQVKSFGHQIISEPSQVSCKECLLAFLDSYGSTMRAESLHVLPSPVDFDKPRTKR